MDRAKAKQALDSRDEMIKVPQQVAIHVNEDGLPVLTLSEGEGKESYSFMLTKRMSQALSEGLMQVITHGTSPGTIH